MTETDIYSSVLDYMCENYDYYLYATDSMMSVSFVISIA